MKVYFSKYRVVKPLKWFCRVGNYFTLDLGFFLASGDDSGISLGFVSPSRYWYSCNFMYRRWRNRNILGSFVFSFALAFSLFCGVMAWACWITQDTLTKCF